VLGGGHGGGGGRHPPPPPGLLHNTPPLRAPAMAVLARALIGLGPGHAAEALDAAREALSTLESLDAIEEGESLVRLTYAEALAAAGDAAAAAAAIARARDSVFARAEGLRDPARRSRFLRDVPENARTVELARAWLEEGSLGEAVEPMAKTVRGDPGAR
jgi:eukaryotic-like serine/threonine-protein kinase